jgi:hypothetical protein
MARDPGLIHGTKTKRRPRIFTPWKMVGALLALGPALLWIVVLTAVLPDETIPRVEIRPDGSRGYFLHEFKGAIVGVTFLPVLGICGFFGIRFAVKKLLQRHGVK